MPAVSKKQQRFFGMVRAAQKGEMENPSPEVSKVAATTSVSSVKKFAKTKHKGLPEKKKMEENFTINKKAHRTAQKFAKIRNLAKKGATEGERAAAEKKSKGPKMFGEGSAYGLYKGDGKPKGPMAAFGKKKDKKSVKEEFKPHKMYDPKTGKGYDADTEEEHLRMKKKGYTHDKPEKKNCGCGKDPCETYGKQEVKEDMSGMSQKSGDKRSTESGAGMTAQGVAKYNRRTGGNLKTAVTTPPSKLKPGSKAANRRKSFCARSKGWTGERGKAARRRWNCSFEPEHGEMISEWDNQAAADRIRRHAKDAEDTAKRKVEAKYGKKTVARSGKDWKQFKKDVESAKGRLRPGEVRKYDKAKGKWVSNKD